MNRSCRGSVLVLLLFALRAAAATEFAPVDAVTDLESAGLFDSGFTLPDGTPRLFAPSTRAGHDKETGAAVDTRSHRDACFMHPPYDHNSQGGVSYQEFNLHLPASPAGSLEGFTSLASGAEKSDGVTFRVRVNGEDAWQEHRPGLQQQPFHVDLAKWAGSAVAIRFEVAPGPRNDTSFDWALWGGRKLLLPRFAGAKHPAPPPLDLRGLSSRQNGSWSPLSGFDGTTSVAVDGRSATLTYRGADGEIVYTWSDGPGPLGTFRATAKMTGDEAHEIPFGRDARLVWTEEMKPDVASFRRRGEAVEMTRHFASAAGATATLGVTLHIEGKSVVLDASCDRPWITEFTPGDWGPVAFRRTLPMPYYGHPVEYLANENLFVSHFPDWSASSASWFQGERAMYDALTDGTLNRLCERFVFSAAWHVDEVLANIPNPPSPWREYFGNAIVLDIWDGRPFDACADSLCELARYDIRDDYIIFHIWQRDGYDNGLPAHWPASARQGGESQMRNLSAASKALGHRLSLHENYVDYYPNFERFTTNDLSLRGDGAPEKAWYNEGTKVQSFAVKPGAILRLAHEQSPEIHARYGTTAGYLDVHSCVPPWFHVDRRAGEPDAGSLQAVWKAHRALWRYEREIHGGPETGEGNGHWFWSGWLDGVEAQFGTGWPHEAGLTAPLLVDFNLLRVHPLQINHGQGYYERWFGRTPPWGGGIPMIALDQYRMQEIVFGHAGFLSHDLWRDPAAAWLEQHLVAPVTARHATQRIREIAYHIGGTWVDTTEAMKRAGDPKEVFGRVRIVYDNGLTIMANGIAGDFAIDGWTLPQFGWIATNRDFAAGTIRRGGAVVDFVDAPDYRFANARRARDWNKHGPQPIEVYVAGFQSLENGRMRFSYDWKAGAKLDRDLRCFVHFDAPGKDGGKPATVTHQDHALPKKTTGWAAGDTVLDGPYEMSLRNLPDGRYAWFIGLFDDAGRLALRGRDDGGRRILLGNLTVSGGGSHAVFEADQAPADTTDWFSRNLNDVPGPVDFGFCRTDGSILMKKNGDRWRLWTYPAPRDFLFESSVPAIPTQAPAR